MRKRIIDGKLRLVFDSEDELIEFVAERLQQLLEEMELVYDSEAKTFRFRRRRRHKFKKTKR